MFLTRPSVSQSVSHVSLVSATPLKPLNRISWNFVVMKDILSDSPSLMLGIAIRCIQHSQAILKRGVCKLAHSFFLFLKIVYSNIGTNISGIRAHMTQNLMPSMFSFLITNIALHFKHVSYSRMKLKRTHYLQKGSFVKWRYGNGKFTILWL